MSFYNIGVILKNLRKQKAFSQKQLAEGICSVEYISKIENGKKNPSPDIISKLFHRLGVNPKLFFVDLSNTDNEHYIAHRFELEKLLGASKYEEAKAYIAALEKEFPFYSSGEPLQYIMGKQAHILANMDKKFDDSYALALHSIQLTKPEFSIKNMKEYEFFSINELWALLYMSAALYWKKMDLKLSDSIQPPIELASLVLSHLEMSYLHPSMIGTLYASAVFYLSMYLFADNRFRESVTVSEKGIDFLTEYYNQILELLGKIFVYQALCKKTLSHQKDADTCMKMGKQLLLLAHNHETLRRYFSLSPDDSL